MLRWTHEALQSADTRPSIHTHTTLHYPHTSPPSHPHPTKTPCPFTQLQQGTAGWSAGALAVVSLFEEYELRLGHCGALSPLCHRPLRKYGASLKLLLFYSLLSLCVVCVFVCLFLCSLLLGLGGHSEVKRTDPQQC